MSKKDRLAMLSGLMGPEDPQASAKPSSKRPALPRRGAIGAISSAVSGLRAAGVMEIEPDRIEIDIEDDAELRRSIEIHGQQVPILVRPHPEDESLWQIVYGRRRVQAARDLGIPVKTLVRDLDDASLVMAQGQENSARRDLSFIEKASFARQMAKAGYERSPICDALAAERALMGSLPSAKTLLADRGYDAGWFRNGLEDLNISPCIPSRRNRKDPIPHDETLYKDRLSMAAERAAIWAE